MFNDKYDQWIGWSFMAVIFAVLYYLEACEPTLTLLLISGIFFCTLSFFSETWFIFGMSSYLISHATWLLMGLENTREWLFHLMMAIVSIPIVVILEKIYSYFESKKANKNSEHLATEYRLKSLSSEKLPALNNDKQANERQTKTIFECAHCRGEFTHRPDLCPGCGGRNFTKVQENKESKT